MALTDPPENVHAVNEPQSDESGPSTLAKLPTGGTTKTRTQLRQELLKLLGFSSFSRLLLVLALEIAVAWLALALALALTLAAPPTATLWQRLQALFWGDQTTLVFLFVVGTAIVVPTFIWFHITFLWVLVLWRRWRTSRVQRSAARPQPPVDPTAPAGPQE